MKNTITLITAISLFLIACNPVSDQGNGQSLETNETSQSTDEAVADEVEMNLDSLIKEIDAKRDIIENGIGEPLEIPTTELREKVKQKWSKIHFYTLNSQLARIKTYPHEGITNRTEEFYFDNGQLMLVVIEDDGSGERGKGKEMLNKLYYFRDGEPIKEVKLGQEDEFSVKDGDAEELLSEADEYIKIYRNNKEK